MNWREQIEAQIASIPPMILELENAGMFAMAEQLRRVKRDYRKTLDVAVAADRLTYLHYFGEGGLIPEDEWFKALESIQALDKSAGGE